MAGMSEYVSNSLVLTTAYVEMAFHKENPPAIQLCISIDDLTQMVQGGISTQTHTLNDLGYT